MASLNAGSPLSMLELAKRVAPDGNLAVIAEILAKTNEILTDIPMAEANDTFSHKIVQRLSLPTGSWRRLNSGVAIEASKTVERVEQIGMLETYSEVDADLVEAAPNPKKFRMNEAAAFLEGMGQTLATTLIYGNASSDPEQFDGLATRLDSLSSGTYYQVVGCGGGGDDLTSIYVVQWGETRAHGLYPRGHQSLGVTHTDKGKVTKSTSTSEKADQAQYEAYRDHFKVNTGLAVPDPRCIARLCNIEAVTDSSATGAFDPKKLIQLLNTMPMRGRGAVLYCNKTIFDQLDIQAVEKTNVHYGPENAFGEPTLMFRGHPVRLCEAITNTESAVS